MVFKVSSLQVNLPFGIGGMNINVDKGQQEAAWALYVELATRIASVELEPDTGSPREALDSLYSIFGTTRSVLRDAGPGAADGPDSVGPLAIEILNKGLRPFVVKWHSCLSDFETAQTEHQRNEFGGEVTVVIDESQWADRQQFHKELTALQANMRIYVDALGSIAGVARPGSKG